MGGHLSHLKPVKHPETQVLPATCGPVRGNVYEQLDRVVDTYLGIPFAKPLKRFERAEAAETWQETLDCTQFGPRPFSGGLATIINKNHKENVDESLCLTLNVFVPQVESKAETCGSSARPVIVFIHGGAFEFGSSAEFNDYSLAGTLSQKNVIVVTLNYRHGIFGFLTTGDEKCQGNFGLWDQTLALKWVQKHIGSFGGDPSNVTVLGHSAGAACTELLSLSPHSRDLFHRMILMSGSAHSSFAIRTKQTQSKFYYDFAKSASTDPYTNNDPSDTASLLEWYKSSSSDQLTDFSFSKEYPGLLLNAPNFDGDFFPKSLNALRKEAPKKPMIIGVTEVEGLVFTSMVLSFDTAEQSFKGTLRNLFNSNDYDMAEETVDEVFKHYTSDINLTDTGRMKRKHAEFVGDYQFNVAALESARAATANGSDVFLYTFDYFDPTINEGLVVSMLPFKAATHSMDLRYVIGEGSYHQFRPTDTDKILIERMTSYFANFATHGNPNKPNVDPQIWRKFDPENPGAHYQIGSSADGGEMVNTFHGDRWRFLDGIRTRSKTRRAIFNGE